MGIYNLHMSPAKGRSVVDKFNYIVREEEYSYLKDDKYDDFIYSDESFVLSKNIMRETYSSLTELYDKSKEIDKRVKNYKLRMLDEGEILFDIYRQLDREDVI